MNATTERTCQIVSPFPIEGLGKLWLWLQTFKDETIDDFSPQTYAELVEKCRADSEAGAKSYAIIHDGQLVGCVWGEPVGNDVYSGHLVFEPYGLKPPEKLEATKQAIKCFFADGARKIRWMALSQNRAYRLFLRRLGAQFEGELKQETKQEGALKDLLLFASFPNGR